MGSLFAVGCTPPSGDRHAVADTPNPVPPRVEAPAPPDPAAPSGADTECGRGSGKRADGACETLRLRKRDWAQQVQIPKGDLVVGDVPRSYDFESTRRDPKLLMAGQPPRPASSASFWIDLHEVTRQAYAACVARGQCTVPECPGGHADPVEHVPEPLRPGAAQTCVTHEQAEAFCRAGGGRLPTEIEWEYAARGPGGWLFPWGNDIRDEYNDAVTAIGGQPGDASYFGIKGMGTSAKEWVADAWDPDAPLRPFVAEDFRRPDGPLRRSLEGGERFVIKGGKAGVRRFAEGARPDVGFRCADDLEPDVQPLTVPHEPPTVAMHKASEQAPLMVFGGVAEAVDRREAEAFCAALRVPDGEAKLEGWRLPTLEEVAMATDVFRGPGPFWIAEGAAAQRGAGKRPVPTDPWTVIDTEPGESLAARCVRPTEG